MDIGAISSALSAVSSYGTSSIGTVAQAASVKMLDNAMESTEAVNAQMIKMMEQSVNPNIGGNIDLSI